MTVLEVEEDPAVYLYSFVTWDPLPVRTRCLGMSDVCDHSSLQMGGRRTCKVPETHYPDSRM